MNIMDSPHVPTDMEDVYACAMFNASEENLLATVDAIAANEKKLSIARREREMRIDDIPVSEHVVGDPMYTPMRLYNTRKEMNGDVKQKLEFYKKFCKREESSAELVREGIILLQQ